MKLTGWGQYPSIETNVKLPKSIKELRDILSFGNTIARGNGRSYGDCSINKQSTIDMRGYDRLINFNEETGLVVVEAGVLLSQIIETFLPRGWFPLVTPGTKFVTIGGMVASDVHGKNHYKNGSFRNCVEWFDIIKYDGEIVKCSRSNNTDLFNWTLGGMGLTGVILKVAFYLRRVNTSWIRQKTISVESIQNTFDIFEEQLKNSYCVAWIDCSQKGKNLGRSLIMTGEHAEINDLNENQKKNPFYINSKNKINIPFNFPPFIINNLTIKLFNTYYFWKGSKQKKNILIDWDSYFYPLDSIINWNRIYGYKGFAQFQCVIPLKKARVGISELLKVLSNFKSYSFLAVLKRFGKQDSFISFPMEGYSLALDFPITKKNLDLMNILDQITIKYEGRFNLSKDSRMSSEVFNKSDKRNLNFKNYRKKEKMIKFSSVQSDRLGL